MSKRNTRILRASALIAGFSLMVIELIATRLMAPYVGSSIYTWTSVIGVILLGMSVGNYVGGMYVDRHGSRKTLSMLLAGTAVATFVSPLLSYFSPMLVLSSLPLVVIIVLLTMLLFFIPAAFFGTLYPAILKLYLEDVASTGAKSGQISALWSLGSIVGTFLTGFYFIGHIGSTTTVLLIACILMGNAAMVYSLKKKMVGVIATLSVLIGAMTYAMHLFTDERGKVYAAESDYYKIQVVDMETKGKGPVRALFLDFDSHSVESKDDQHLDTYPEIYPIFGAMNDTMHDVLVLGGGAYTLSKNIAEKYKGSDVTTVELDPKVRDVAEEYFDVKKYPIKTEVSDGRVFLERTNKTYDLIFSDAYNSFISVPWHMATKEFDQLAKDHLNEGGIYALNFTSTRKGGGSEFFKSMEKTFGSVFGRYYVFAYGENEYGPQNIILVGSKDDKLPDTETIRTKIDQGENGRFLSARLIESTKDISDDIPILTDEYAPVERLMLPVVDEYFSQYAEFYYGAIFPEEKR